jgi:hypothetical protein
VTRRSTVPPRPLLSTLVAGALMLVGCTSGSAEAPPLAGSASADTDCPVVADACDEPVEVDDAVFDLVCVPVPRFLLDVSVGARWGGAKVRAIAAVPAVQAVAVRSPDPDVCGEWSLAMRTDLSPDVRMGIEQEIREAESLPPDPAKPGDDPIE